MKYFLILTLFILANCTHTKRAGSYYNPKFYQNIQDNYANKVQKPIIKVGTPVRQFHSALGDFCSYYQDGDITNSQLICHNGHLEKQVRILQ